MNKYFFGVVKCIIFLMPVFFVGCNSSNISKDDNLEKYFKTQDVEGCFAVFNNGKGSFNMYNLSWYKDSSAAPAATFNVMNSLVAIQVGKLFNEKSTIKNSSVTKTFDSAFLQNDASFFASLAANIGKDTMQHWLDSVGYGSKTIKTTTDNFYNDNSLTISADEQLGFIKKLYFDQLPFSKNAMTLVKKLLIKETNSNYTLAYVQGDNLNKQQLQNNWVVGWLEHDKHPIFFVLNFRAKTNKTQIGIELAKNCLKDLGYINK
jgi:beta-lactamase class D